MGNWIYHQPGGLDDFPNPADWDKSMQANTTGIMLELASQVLGKPVDEINPDDVASLREQVAYADPIASPPPAGTETVPIQAWGGFPRGVKIQAPWTDFPPAPGDAQGIYRAVEHQGQEDFGGATLVDKDDNVLHLPVRDRQDEYLEWVARRDSNGKIIKITFVAEGYDYFQSLYESGKDGEKVVVDLYQRFTGVTTIQADDLRASNGITVRYPKGQQEEISKPGGFNPRNRFNLNPGIVHLSHKANALGAEVILAGVSGLARKNVAGAVIDGADPQRLLCCNDGGEPTRNSDPLISQQAYAQVMQGYKYTLADPVGLYIANIEDGLLLPDNKTAVPRDWWTVVRGEGDPWNPAASRILRLELAPPAGDRNTISDLFIDGAQVLYPGQIAELLNVHLFVTRWKRAIAGTGPVVPCLATCCRRIGTETLVTTTGSCAAQGYELAYPGLIPAQAPHQLAAMAMHVVGAPVAGAGAPIMHRRQGKSRW